MEQQLIVEGKDAIAIANLLKERGLPPPNGYEHPKKFKDQFVVSAGGYQNAIVALHEALDRPEISNIGLIIDADQDGAEVRWSAIRKVLLENGAPVNLKERDIKHEGIIIEVENFPKVGIWVMPNNMEKGYLEHFLISLISDEDQLLQYADKVLNDLEAQKLNRYGSLKRGKALIHTWLSWQKEPGRPFGQAIEMGYLDAQSANADAFENWFKQTFELEGG